ncbi:Hypothetical predicted protein [Lecanosticta acicola]|uniref:Thioesterase domain-containing protein n=1 Tax=Lecanosticta acicola TaxID=111012 RepID=A0AAI9EB88_9PEZI|nr:Hypothetical predicted protein [Lecanosticta acicola]
MIPPGESFAEKFFPVTTSQAFEDASAEERINMFLSVKTPHDIRFSSQFMENEVKLHSFKQTSRDTALAVFKFRISRFYCNGAGNLHGGAQSFVYDMLTSIALSGIGKKDWWLNAGVSRSLNVTYLRPAPEGTDVLCEVEVMSAGKKMALTRGVIKRESDGLVYSTCEHDKAAVAAKAGTDVQSKL